MGFWRGVGYFFSILIIIGGLFLIFANPIIGIIPIVLGIIFIWALRKNGLQEQKDSLNTLITYCFAHADRPNPIQDLIDKGFLPSEFNGKTCISIKQMISELNNQITSVQTEINNTTKKTECQYIQRENSTTVWDKICPNE
jgi:hypothetical protein